MTKCCLHFVSCAQPDTNKKGRAEMAGMRTMLIAIAALALLFGCTGSSVPQEKYDALAASCEKAKTDAAGALAGEKNRADLAEARLATCNSNSMSLEQLLAAKEQENELLSADAAVLAKARVKTDMILQYELAEEYYLDAFGPGRLPNTAKMERMDAQVALLDDSGLAAAWNSVKDCQGITGCGTAKAKMAPYIGNQTQKLALDAAAIVGAAE